METQLCIFEEPKRLYVIEEKIGKRWIFALSKFTEEEAKKFVEYCNGKKENEFRYCIYERKGAKIYDLAKELKLK